MTAVEWIINALLGEHTNVWEAEVKTALEMEKEQIKQAWIRGWKDSYIEPLEDKYYEQEADQYYNQTFKKGTDL